MSEDGKGQRREELLKALADIQVEFRDDSMLSKSYIAGALGPEYSAEIVAQVCAMHKFLFCFTSYASDCKTLLPQMAAQLAAPLGSYNAAYNFVKTYKLPLIKTNAINLAGGIPEIWPWLKKSN